ncbi:MAG: potassium transporter Kup, partial [Duncaniella sp.]|nr:potassium transporter Kup [Duncaniella sp.]
KDIKADADIPKYASNVIYFSRYGNDALIESKLIYSIINKQPKRADHYWIIHIENVDAPETLEYSVKVIVPQTVYFVTLRLGFRVDPKVSVYLRQIVEDLVDEGSLDLVSGYPSLRRRAIAGNFRFIIIHRIFSPSSSCRKGAAFLMRLHEWLRRLGISDQTAMGLDTSVVTLETVPLIINNTPLRRIARVECV